MYSFVGLGCLNEIVTWSHSCSTPCALSIDLLTRLKEIIKATLETASGSRTEKIKLVLTQSIQNKFRSSSAFKSFERDSCELQVSL